MLTQQDLQAIRKIVQTEVRTEVRKEVRQEVRKELKKELDPIKKKLMKIDKIERDLATAIHLFDNGHHELEERVVRPEETVYR